MNHRHAEPAPPEAWPDAIESALAGCNTLRDAVVLRETASTQDHARAAGVAPGTLVTALRQTAGRGRLGRAWEDTRDAGVAVTFALPDDSPESLAMRSAVAAAEAVRTFVPGNAAGIKWPNDVVVDGRKIAGVLVERTAGVALVGIGINVGQREFPPELDAHATSLARLAVTVDRLHVLLALIRAVDHAFTAPADAIYRTYSELDRLSGRACVFRTPEGVVEGTVLSVDPLRGLALETASGPRFLPASTTSVVPPPSGSRYGGGNVPSTGQDH